PCLIVFLWALCGPKGGERAWAQRSDYGVRVLSEPAPASVEPCPVGQAISAPPCLRWPGWRWRALRDCGCGPLILPARIMGCTSCDSCGPDLPSPTGEPPTGTPPGMPARNE